FRRRGDADPPRRPIGAGTPLGDPQAGDLLLLIVTTMPAFGDTSARRAAPAARRAPLRVMPRHRMARHDTATSGACTILGRYYDQRGVSRAVPVTDSGVPLDSDGEAP